MIKTTPVFAYEQPATSHTQHADIQRYSVSPHEGTESTPEKTIIRTQTVQQTTNASTSGAGMGGLANMGWLAALAIALVIAAVAVIATVLAVTLTRDPLGKHPTDRLRYCEDDRRSIV
jgi:hypothetical protein